MAQKNTLFNYFTKSPAQSKVQNGGGGSPSETNGKILQKSKGVTPTSASKKATKTATAKTGTKKVTKTSTPIIDVNKEHEGKGN
jgi:hypothetical protein